MKTGLIGGSFNPPHIAHLIIAEAFREQANLDRCIFIPARVSPFKTEDPSMQLAGPQQRYEMTRLAIADNSSFSISDYEINSDEISYTYKTILHFRNLFPGDILFWLFGQDHIGSFTKWKNWQTILDNAIPAIAGRPGNWDDSSELQTMEEFLARAGRKPIRIEAPLMEISSSDIRNRLAAGHSVRYMLCDNVYQYIMDNQIYIG